MLNDVAQNLQQLRDKLNRDLGSKQALEARLQQTQTSITSLEASLDTLTKASLFLQTLSDVTRKDIIDKVSAIVTDALQKVKDKNLEFKMLLSTERNQFDIQFVVVDTETKHEYDILTSCGGTIADLVTFPLRVCLLLKWEPTLSRILLLDETFKFVSTADQEALGDFVRQLSEKLNLQIILITHSQTLASKAHRIFQVTKAAGVSSVEEKPS